MGSHLRLGIVGVVVGLGLIACGASREHEEREDERSPSARVERTSKVSSELTTTVAADQATHLRQGSPNQNFSTLPLRLQASGHNRALVHFTTSSLSSFGSGPVTLKLTISSIAENWDGGRQVAVHRVLRTWTEAGATWNCGVDTNTQNSVPDCSGATQWEMDGSSQNAYAATPTATAIISNASTGEVSFDVSSDVALFRSGSVSNFGFLVRKTDEGQPGKVEFANRSSSTPPVLVGEAADAGTDSGADTGSSSSSSGGSGDAASDTSPACSPSTCTSSSACIVAQCVSGTCTMSPAVAGTSCPTGSACSTGACNGAGSCVATPITLPPPSPCHTVSCDPVTGISTAPSPDGTSCDDGDACSVSDHCSAGTCIGGGPRTCTPSGSCVQSACNSATGCVESPLAAGTSCEPTPDVCDGISRCDGAGHCQAGTPLSCGSSDPCLVTGCNPTTGCTSSRTPGCDSTPVGTDQPWETRASLLAQVVSSSGSPIGNASFTVYDERASGTPRSDVVVSGATAGSFKLKLTAFPTSEPDRSPPHRLVVAIDAPNTLRAYRVAYAHPGDSIDLGTIRLVGRDPLVTNIGPAGGTATDSQNLVEIVIPPGALTTTIPVRITPFTAREDFPAPLPDATLTMYGFEAEPSGTTFAAPVTVRVSNYRNLPTSLEIPLGSFDPVENRWDTEGVATWDGAKFATTTTHFSEKDMNGPSAQDLVLLIAKGGNANKGAGICQTGSAWQAGGGSASNVFPLPGTRARSEDLSFSLHYDSGLAGSRKIEPARGTSTLKDEGIVPRSTLAVAMPGTVVGSLCTSRGPSGGGGGGATQPGVCAVSGGKCGHGGAGFRVDLFMLGALREQAITAATDAVESAFGGWMTLPLGEAGELPSPGLVTQKMSVYIQGATAGSACASGGGTFGAADPAAQRVQLDAAEAGAALQSTRKVLVNHRFTSPYGAGWAIREISRLYTNGDRAVLLSGEGKEEDFQPRARVRTMPESSLGDIAFTRDVTTGELFAAVAPGTIYRLDPSSGARTSVLSGLAFPAESIHSMTVAYVGGSRHFVVGFRTGVVDYDAAGAGREVATRGQFGGHNTAPNQVSLAAWGDKVFYTKGNPADAVLFRIDLAQASPTPVQFSSRDGDKSLFPKTQLGNVQFTHPLGMTFAPNGVL